MIDINEMEQISSLARLLTSIVFLNKIFFCLRGFDFHWAHVKSQIEINIIKILLKLQIFLLLLLFFGLLIKPVSLTIFLIYLYTFFRSSLFGLEDVYFTPLILYSYLSSNFNFSLDKIYNFNDLAYNQLILSTSFLPEIILSLICSSIFFSASVEKMKSKMWKSGFAIKYFFFNPKFRKVNLEPILINSLTVKLLTYSTLLSQFLLLPMFIFLPGKFSILILIPLIIFTLFLIFFFLYVCLAEACLIILTVQTACCFFLWDLSLYQYFKYNIVTHSNYDFLILMITICILLIYISDCITFKGKNIFSNSSKLFFIIFKLPRYIFGLLKVDVYSEKHLTNSVAFRTYLEDGKSKFELFQMYNEDGSPKLKNVFFLPSVYMCVAFKIHDILIQLSKNKKLSYNYKRFLDGYIRFLLKNKKINLKINNTIILYTNKINLNNLLVYNKNIAKKMEPTLKITISENFEYRYEILNKKQFLDSNRKVNDLRFEI